MLHYLAKRSNRVMKNTTIRIARAEAGLSQEQLAAAVGVTRQTIGLIETGEYNPSLKLCLAICHKLHKTLNDLFWEE
jgi:putative transcriptional regulator